MQKIGATQSGSPQTSIEKVDDIGLKSPQRRYSLFFSDGEVEDYDWNEMEQEKKKKTILEYIIPPSEIFLGVFGVLVITLFFYKELGF